MESMMNFFIPNRPEMYDNYIEDKTVKGYVSFKTLIVQYYLNKQSIFVYYL